MTARLLQFFCGLVVVIGLNACSSRPTSDVLAPVARDPSYTSKVQLLVATTREQDPTNPSVFGVERAKALNYAALTVSIPKAHKSGQIEWPDQPDPDPALHFLTTQRETLTKSDFLRGVQQRTSESTSEQGSVLVFIHGYNTRYEESVYRLAQIVHDSGFTGTAVLFAWPSRGKAPLYLADRDASTYSRDYLEQALLDVAALPGTREINVLAHSMGNWLTVETLRQAKMKGHGDFSGKLGEIILASPDIDVTVFRTQLNVIAPMRRPITVLVSGDDKALAFSSLLSGGNARVGMVAANDVTIVESAQRYNLRVIDLTKIDDGSQTGHAKFAQSSAVVSAIGRGLAHDDAKGKLQSGVFQAVTDAGTSLLKIPAAIIGLPLPVE
jgi:esterase/lipase superfamily enzyme